MILLSTNAVSARPGPALSIFRIPVAGQRAQVTVTMLLRTHTSTALRSVSLRVAAMPTHSALGAAFTTGSSARRV